MLGSEKWKCTGKVTTQTRRNGWIGMHVGDFVLRIIFSYYDISHEWAHRSKVISPLYKLPFSVIQSHGVPSNCLSLCTSTVERSRRKGTVARCETRWHSFGRGHFVVCVFLSAVGMWHVISREKERERTLATLRLLCASPLWCRSFQGAVTDADRTMPKLGGGTAVDKIKLSGQLNFNFVFQGGFASIHSRSQLLMNTFNCQGFPEFHRNKSCTALFRKTVINVSGCLARIN